MLISSLLELLCGVSRVEPLPFKGLWYQCSSTCEERTIVNFSFVSSVHTRRAEWPQEQGLNSSLYDFSGYSSHWAVWESTFNTSQQLCMSAQSMNIGSAHMEHLYWIIRSGYQNTMNHFRKPKLKFKIMVLHRRVGDGVSPLVELHDKCFLVWSLETLFRVDILGYQIGLLQKLPFVVYCISQKWGLLSQWCWNQDVCLKTSSSVPDNEALIS